MTISVLETNLLAEDPEAAARACVEAGAEALLLDTGSLPPEFFDLSTRVLGSLLHKLDQYRIRLAAVVPDVQSRSGPFQDFVREANAGARFRFFSSREDATKWLETLQED